MDTTDKYFSKFFNNLLDEFISENRGEECSKIRKNFLELTERIKKEFRNITFIENSTEMKINLPKGRFIEFSSNDGINSLFHNINTSDEMIDLD